MRKILGGFAAVVLVAGLSTSAMAARKKPVDPNKPKNYDFSADTIEGELARPDGENLDVRGYEKHSSLIRIRADFIREIVKSAEDL